MYQVGWDKQEIQITPKGYAMFGYGQWSHRAYEQRTALFARSFSIVDQQQHRLIICCLDLGCITHAMRSQSMQRLQQILGSQFDENQLVLMATHTHSGPGGCAHEALYNMPTPGFVPEHLNAIVDAIVLSIQTCINTEQDTEICLGTQHFAADTPVAWNRSIKAYNRNPEVKPYSERETHLALNREMQLIGFYREQKLQSFISLFGVHATCLGNIVRTSKNQYNTDMSYPIHFRKKILAKLEEGQSIRAVAQHFEINKNTIVEWKKRIEIKRTRPRKPSKVDDDALRADVEQYPDDYQYERAARFGCGTSTIGDALKRLNITIKKKPYGTRKQKQNSESSI